MNEHTPGPWREARYDLDQWWLDVAIESVSEEEAVVYTSSRATLGDRALIIAAPDLLAEVRRLHTCVTCEDGCPTAEVVRKATTYTGRLR